MILLYKNLINKGYSDYQIKKLLSNKQLYLVEKGVYSEKKDYDYLEVLVKKHFNIIITLETACYCYKLVKKRPQIYKVATKQKDRKINDNNIKQIFMTDSLYPIGKTTITYQTFKINIYDLERLLIEIVRSKTNIDYDIYKEIINNYKKVRRLLNKNKLLSYIESFKDNKIIERINNEVYEKQELI